MEKIQYPLTHKVDQVVNYHGTLVADPYRWLEDPNSAQTKEWIDNQNELTQKYLGDIPDKNSIKQRLTELWDFPRAYAPLKVNGKYCQLRNTGLQNQNVLYMMDSLEGEKSILLDPNQLSDDGTIALTDWKISKDGNYLAYATSKSGSDWRVWKIKNITTEEDLQDRVEWTKFSTVAWAPESTGFHYCAYDQPENTETYEALNQGQKVMYHKLGTDQSHELLVYESREHPEWGFDPIISDDGKYLILEISKGTDRRNLIFLCELDSQDTFTELIPELEATYKFVGNTGDLFYFRTNYLAPNGKLISVDIGNPERNNWKTIIPEGQDAIETIKISFNQFVILYLHDAYHQIKRFEMDGNYSGSIELPMLGEIFSADLEEFLSGKRSDDELFFVFNSFIYPPTVCRYSFISDTVQEIEKPEIPFDFENYKVAQIFVKSQDGTRVPMFLVRKKDAAENQVAPTLLYGYGGFNISITPGFLVSRLVWLELGGLLAVANLRGGGEYG